MRKIVELLHDEIVYLAGNWEDIEANEIVDQSLSVLISIKKRLASKEKIVANICNFLEKKYQDLQLDHKTEYKQIVCQDYINPVLVYLKDYFDEKHLTLGELQLAINKAIEQKLFKQAEQYLMCLIAAFGSDEKFFYITAYVFLQLEKYEEAVAEAEFAIKYKSCLDAEAYMIIGFAKRGLFMYREAISALETSNLLVLKDSMIKESAFVGRNFLALGQLYMYVGEIKKACEAYLSASKYNVVAKEKCEAYSSYLMCLHYEDVMTSENLFQEHCKYKNLLSSAPKETLYHMRKKKKIRIGYISPDFRQHVMSFFYRVFLQYYNKQSFEVYCYCLNEEDKITTQLKRFVNQWRNVKGLDNYSVASLIAQDEVDILVDLAGHSANNALPILNYRPAPVQISGLGYFNTTGLKTVDYILTDNFVDPIGIYDNLFSEKLLRLPYSQFCYTPWDDAPTIGLSPYIKNGYITFGCFNKYAKITNQAIEVWSQILKQVKGSKLILKSLVYIDENFCKEVFDRFAEFGIEERKLELRPATSDYMEQLRDIDIALDTFPYPGGGTTCDTLYMGVPVITMEGQRHGARFGYSILCNVGLGELVAKNTQEYIEKAVVLANDLELIDILHKNLRTMMEKSPLMDTQLYMQEIERAYSEILANKWLNG